MFALALLWRIALAPGVALGLLEASAAQARLWHRRGRNHRPSRRGERGEKRDRAAARARRRTRTAGQQQGRAVVMELILLLIYSFFVWLIFFKFKWLPWNIVSQVIVCTLPVIGLTILILILNIVAPSSHDVRVLNYVVQIVPRVTGRVTEV